MHRPGANPDAMTEADFLCDFCRRHYTDARPMIEGHQGSLICAHCVGVAYTELVLAKSDAGIPPETLCVLCLETGSDQPKWRSPIREAGVICRRCTKRTAGLFHSDPEIDWKKPTASGP